MNGLDLFSGIGGISMALSEYVKTIGYVEIDKYAQSVLLSRMVDGSIETAPIFRDITKLDGRKLRGHVDIISGGFPCQDISVAGNGKGLEGQRSGLFFEVVRLTKEIRPSFVFLENVPAIRTRGLEQVIKAFAEVGYDCRWTMLTAASVGANHKRERWFLLANTNASRRVRSDSSQSKEWDDNQEFAWASSVAYTEHDGQLATTTARGNGENYRKKSQGTNESSESSRGSEYRDISGHISESTIPNTSSKGLERQWQESVRTSPKFNHACDESWWLSEPRVGRVVDGLQDRSHRIKCLGNSVVPLQVKTAFERLMGL